MSLNQVDCSNTKHPPAHASGSPLRYCDPPPRSRAEFDFVDENSGTVTTAGLGSSVRNRGKAENDRFFNAPENSQLKRLDMTINDM
jgi:hypothetical protein